MRALHAIVNTPWCITEDALKTIVAIAKRENLSPEAVEAQTGRKLEYTRSVTERGGVATIPIDGPIFRKANLFTTMSGATSLEILAKDFAAALHNPQIRAILLAIDSPGGEVTGVGEFAEMVYAARGQKPIYAYVEGLGASAAYWIASACEQVIAAPTAMLGSIGVIAAMDADDSDQIVFVSTQSPNKHPDPQSETGAAQIQALIDATADVFIAAVAKQRGVKRATVMERYGAGGVMVGADAVAAGLADRLGAYEAVLSELQANPGGRASIARAASTSVPAMSAGPILSSVSPAPIAARPPIPVVIKERPMSDETRAPEPPAVDLPSISDAAMQAQINAYVGQMEARFKAQQDAAFQRAQAEFERRIADMEQRRQIESYAQHITTPTINRPHALFGTADEWAALLTETPPTVRAKWQTKIDHLLSNGLVAFEEIGSDGEADAARSTADQWQALITAKLAMGMSRVDAIKAAAAAHPDLYAAQATMKGGR